MEFFKHKLKVVSWVLIALAVFNAIMLGIGWKNGELREEAKARLNQSMVESGVAENEVEGMEDTLSNVVFYTVVILTILGILFKVYLGVKGLNQADGKVKGKANIVLATIVLICSIISVGTSIMPLIRKEMSVASFVSSLCGLLIIAYYVVAASKVVKAVES